MNKKLCVLINGSMRLPEQTIIDCIEDCKQQFSFIEHDIWVFTWKTDNNIEKSIQPHVFKLIANEPSPTFLDLDWLEIPFTEQLKQHPEHAICRVSHYSTMYGLNCIFEEIAKSGIMYEYALRMRNDIVVKIDHPESWFHFLEPKKYITPPMMWSYLGINDHMGLGFFDDVKNIWTYDEEHFKTVIPQCWNFELYIQKRLEMFDIKNIIMPVSNYVVKRTNRAYPNGAPMEDWILI